MSRYLWLYGIKYPQNAEFIYLESKNNSIFIIILKLFHLSSLF